jgi:hypothetical protein
MMEREKVRGEKERKKKWSNCRYLEVLRSLTVNLLSRKLIDSLQILRLPPYWELCRRESTYQTHDNDDNEEMTRRKVIMLMGWRQQSDYYRPLLLILPLCSPV